MMYLVGFLEHRRIADEDYKNRVIFRLPNEPSRYTVLYTLIEQCNEWHKIIRTRFLHNGDYEVYFKMKGQMFDKIRTWLLKLLA